MMSANLIAKPIRGLGGFFGMSLDTFVAIFTPPFAWAEFVNQVWFVARVSMVPALLLALPYAVISGFLFNILLGQFGAADFSGTGSAFFAVSQIAPLATVIVVSGAGATAMCADLGARTIREEIDAQRVMGVDPIRALVVPRVLAATLVSLLIVSQVVIVGLVGAYFLSVYYLHVSAGAFVEGMTLLTGLDDVIVTLIKATLFGVCSGLIACYKGISVRGGPSNVGIAVNETVVFCFLVLFMINILVTAVGVQFTIS
ncbi:ABC transporter permease [Mycolicibacillus koreensis]|uniref:ABC transporter permease n=2 Tax=Mycolicibacillus koreensis TaxID=1069220 RepID=A0AA91PB43_9MYCO|nr:ABC transporter permease [Mycolicibacillus koreensis]OSC25743.1 ABC transporter permease [Mycolicibacillus koreensis]